MKTFDLSEASSFTGLEQALIKKWIAEDWISPIAPESLDQEDVARLQLINELQKDFGSNDASIPLILHLVDQLCHFQAQLRRLKGKWT